MNNTSINKRVDEQHIYLQMSVTEHIDKDINMLKSNTPTRINCDDDDVSNLESTCSP